MERPVKSREELIAAERAAELNVRRLEAEYLMAQAADAPDTDDKHIALAEARVASLRVRKEMKDGLAAWTSYLAYEEARRAALESGLVIEGE